MSPRWIQDDLHRFYTNMAGGLGYANAMHNGKIIENERNPLIADCWRTGCTTRIARRKPNKSSTVSRKLSKSEGHMPHFGMNSTLGLGANVIKNTKNSLCHDALVDGGHARIGIIR